MNELLRKSADILGISVDSLREFPEDIQNQICSAMQVYEVSDEQSARQQYDEMERLWRDGTLILGMAEISKNTGIPQDKLMGLSENEKLNLMYEYAIGADVEMLKKIADGT